MNDIDVQLKKIRTRQLSHSEKEYIWHGVRAKKSETVSLLELVRVRFMTGAIIAIFLLLTGGGVVAASDSAKPGDTLYGIDLAVERAELSIKKNKTEVAHRIAEERLQEAERLSEKQKNNVSSAVVDLSAVTMLSIEADVFTNETVVKVEANDVKYGFSTQEKTKDAVVAAIAARYTLSVERVNAVLDFEIEDRASRSDDGMSDDSSDDSSDDDRADFNQALTQTIAALGATDDALLQALIALQASNDDGKIKIERNGMEIEIESEDGVISIEVEEDDSDDRRGRGGDDSRDDSDDDARSSNGAGTSVSTDDSSDDVDTNDDSDDDSDSSNHGGDDEDDSAEDDDHSGSGKDDDEGDDDSGTSGHGGDDDEDDD